MIEQKVNHADKIEKRAIPAHLHCIEQEHEVKYFLQSSQAFMFTNQNGILRWKNNAN